MTWMSKKQKKTVKKTFEKEVGGGKREAGESIF